MSVLNIIASARTEQSNSRILSQYLIDSLGEPVVEHDLGQQPLPAISAEDLIDLHASADKPRDSLQLHLALSNRLISELKAADTLVLATPVYNFGIPAELKRWVDYICRAGITFKYGESGPVGLSGVKRAFIITAAGGVTIGSDMDFASRYLELICGFIGVEEVIHIAASGSKGSPAVVIAEGKQQIDQALAVGEREQIAVGE
jgi:FMN-dependent NADH-azoreductase